MPTVRNFTGTLHYLDDRALLESEAGEQRVLIVDNPPHGLNDAEDIGRRAQRAWAARSGPEE
jgi:hypothetical protein